MLGPVVKILCLVMVSSFLISDGEAKGVNWGPLLEALLENEIRPQSTAGVSEFYSILVQSSFKIFSKPFWFLGNVRTLIGSMQGLMRQLDVTYKDGLNMNVGNYNGRPMVGKGWMV